MGIRRTSRKGQGLSEYGLVLGLVAVVSIAALSSTGSAVSGLLGQITGAVAAGTNPCDYQGCYQTCYDAYVTAGQTPEALAAGIACVQTCETAYASNNCAEQEQGGQP